jgi:hypothetical protein
LSQDGLTLEPHERVDDESIKPDALLWRLIDKQYWIKRNETGVALRRADGNLLVSSESFNTQEVSVRISDAITFEKLRQGYPDIPIAEIDATAIRSERCIIARDKNDRSHGLIYDEKRPGEVELKVPRARRIINACKIREP